MQGGCGFGHVTVTWSNGCIDTLSEDWDLFKKKWFEVGVVYLEDILKPYHMGGGSNLSSYASSYLSSLANSPYYREKSGSSELISGCGLMEEIGPVWNNIRKAV